MRHLANLLNAIQIPADLYEFPYVPLSYLSSRKFTAISAAATKLSVKSCKLEVQGPADLYEFSCVSLSYLSSKDFMAFSTPDTIIVKYMSWMYNLLRIWISSNMSP